jgi:pimeloyl-ACP methyl ester carboxylesterase
MIPGIQGRWEWMAPAVDALARSHRVLSFSLDTAEGAKSSATRSGADSLVFERYDAHIDALLDARNLDRAAIVGVSFGGLVAVHYASHRAERVSALVLVSPPAPDWRPDLTQAAYLRRPRWSAPAFAARGCARLVPEVVAAKSHWGSRIGFFGRHLGRIVRFPARPTRMAARVRDWQQIDLSTACRAIAAPTLVITGDAALDRVVPQSSSLEYMSMIRGARHETLNATGHIGIVTKPEEFVHLVSAFVAETAKACESQETPVLSKSQARLDRPSPSPLRPTRHAH